MIAHDTLGPVPIYFDTYGWLGAVPLKKPGMFLRVTDDGTHWMCLIWSDDDRRTFKVPPGMVSLRA